MLHFTGPVLSFEASLVRQQLQLKFFSSLFNCYGTYWLFYKNEFAETWVIYLLTWETVSVICNDLTHFRAFISSVAVSSKWIKTYEGQPQEMSLNEPNQMGMNNKLHFCCQTLTFQAMFWGRDPGAVSFCLLFDRSRNPFSAIASYVFFMNSAVAVTLTTGKTCSDPVWSIPNPMAK